MAYFLTGATGFIGHNLLERLLAREGDIYVLVREGSEARLERLIKRWEGSHGPQVGERVHHVAGNLTLPLLGVEKVRVADLRSEGIEHFFHLAAVYDMTASEERNRNVNVGGTAEAVALAKALGAGCFHHVSSIAVAGDFKGVFREDMFDEGQRLPSPYHKTKFESERIVREQAKGPWRVYRPAIVVGDSRTGEMDKIDGPYYFFKAIQRMRRWLPQWLPLVGLDLGYTNIVPVDFVADALDHIAHKPGLDKQAFHLTNPRSQRVSDVMNEFAKAAHAPHSAVSIDRRLAAPGLGVLTRLTGAPGVREARRALLGDFGIPEEVIEHISLRPRFDTTAAEAALAGSGIAVPALSSYAGRLWDWWERHLDPDRLKERSLQAALNGRTVLITGASSGIGKATALKVAAAGGIPLLVARGTEKLEEVKQEIEAEGGSAYVYSADLSNLDSIDELVAQVLAEHAAVDMLVNNAGRSIRRSVALSYDRFHDYERTIQLNYLGSVKLIMGLLPPMRARGSGHIVNISSIGVQTNPPRFSAYVASKAALDAFTRVASSEVLGDGVTFTTIHMPLVRTPMIAPTKMYDSFPAATPEEAADMVCEALRSKPKVINTRLGTFGEVFYALAPNAVDRILHAAYRVFPDSAAARGEKDVEERASAEQIAMATLMRGVHW
jgi:NAD(P)-dependent dehydrogenase (short-subunit alcohol dehydrogenase family)